jgi:transposase-like protein
VTDIAITTQQEARVLTDRIKVAVEGTWLLIQDAYTSRAWAALGYPNWDSYCTEEFGASRLRLPREERQEVVASLRESGLSIRAIVAATGISDKTITKDLRQVSESTTPDEITGTDGKSYSSSRPEADWRQQAVRRGINYVQQQRSQEATDEFAGSEWLEPDEDAHPGQSHVLDHTGLETVAPTVTTPTPTPEPVKPKRRPLPEAFADATRDLKRTAEQLARLTQDDRFTRNRDTTHHQMPELLGALEHAAALVQAMNLPEAPASEEARRWWATSLNAISDTLAGVARSIDQEN